jgi:DNA-binding helix-hairpin-helix protein with protein kinase domain
MDNITLSKSARGHMYESLIALGASGGQGEVLISTRRDGHDARYAIKVMHAGTPDDARRASVLMESNLSASMPLIVLPSDVVYAGKRLGIVTPFIDAAVPLEELLSSGTLYGGYPAHVFVALQLSYACAILADAGLYHGDLHTSNILVQARKKGSPRIFLIDFDNCFGLNLPPPPMLGQHHCMAPEVAAGKSRPTPQSEVFALASVLHDLLLVKPSLSGFGNTDADLERARSSTWMYDPQNKLAVFDDGFAAEMLHPKILQLFRDTLQPDASMRPAIGEWFVALRDLYCVEQRLAACLSCTLPVFLQRDLDCCPHCRASFDRSITTPTGDQLRVNDLLSLGREHCDSPHVSRKHAFIRRRGPELFITPASHSCLTAVLINGGEWHPLTTGDCMPLPPGSTFRLADQMFIAQ